MLEKQIERKLVTAVRLRGGMCSKWVSPGLDGVPDRVARDTWPEEIKKWDHLKGLTYSVAVGSPRERKAALMQNTHIHIINRENLKWLVEKSHLRTGLQGYVSPDEGTDAHRAGA